MKYRWLLSPAEPTVAGRLADELKVPLLLAQCLLNRGLREPARIRDFLEPRLKRLADPFLLPNMEAAVERLLRAREKQERVVIFGDYDVDGVTSTALLLEALPRLGWKVDYYLPHRMDEGYGLSQEAVESCFEKLAPSLLLAVDCGSTTVDSIAWLRGRGVDVLVLDHHQVSSPAPAAVALVNPQLGGPGKGQEGRKGREGTEETPAAEPADRQAGPAPFTELCSVGLAFKLVHALVKRGRDAGLPGAEEFDLRPLLDLVALGTVADIVPLCGENRILVSAGLTRLETTLRPGLVALKRVAQCEGELGTYEVGFLLAPRLNAAGRLETAEDALRLLLARSPAEALLLAQKLDAQNHERQRIQRGITQEVIEILRARFNPESDYVIVEGQAVWHIGVVGIVASRVVQEFYRPTIIVGGDGAEWRGSGRSIAGFDLAGALRECGDLLVRHGGHAMAAGLTIQAANLEAFRERLNALARKALKSEELQAPLRLDAEVRLSDVSLQCVEAVERLKPTGPGNLPVHFCARGLKQQRLPMRMGAEKRHVKMWVTDGKATHECVWWNAGEQSAPEGEFDLAFAPQVNEYDGRRLVQLKLLDWRAAV